MTEYHIDCEFEGERLVDDVQLMKDVNKGKVICYSPKLRAIIIINKKELRNCK